MDSREEVSLKNPRVITAENVDGKFTYNDERTVGTRNSATRVRRLFSFAQIFFFALGYMSSWEAIAANIGLVFYNGGPRAVVWGFFVVVPGILCQVASLAELAAVQPIAGAQYHWTHYLAPYKYRRFITWIQGWLTWFSWISLLAGVINVGANQITTLVSAEHLNYTLQGWHTILIMYAMLVITALINVYAFWIIPWIELLAGLIHVVLWIVFVSVLVALAPKHSAEWVFFETSELSSWNNTFVQFNLGMVLVTWGFVGFDGAVHMSEEVRKARHSVPRAMFWTICINAALAFGMTIVFLFCLGDVENVLSAGFPVIAIAMNATKSVVGSSAMVGGLLIVNTAVSLGSVASASRLTWAWSRDGGLPAYFSRIDPKHRIPVRSVWLPVLIVMLLALLNLADYTAFSVIIALSTFGLYQSYFLAIACMLYARLNGQLGQSGWSLGSFGVPINIFALAYSLYMSIWLVTPTALPVDAKNMNYALPIYAFVLVIAILLWFGWAKRNWKGLNKEVVDMVLADSDRNTED